MFHLCPNAKARSNWFCPVSLWPGGKDFPSGHHNPSRRTHPFNPCSGAYESQCCWHVKSQMGKESLPRPPEQKKLISKRMLGEQPSSAGRGQSAPDHSVRDSWPPEQFLLHGSFSLQTTLPFQTSPHLPLRWPTVSGTPTLFSSFHSLWSFICEWPDVMSGEVLLASVSGWLTSIIKIVLGIGAAFRDEMNRFDDFSGTERAWWERDSLIFFFSLRFPILINYQSVDQLLVQIKGLLFYYE